MCLGKTISNIRKNKNIPVKYLINNCMSRSTYNYFTEGKTDISANKLITLINRLNITWNEFNYIYNHYDNFLLDFNRNIQQALLNMNISKLQFMKSNLKLRYKYHRYNKYFYLYCILNILIEKLENKSLKRKYKYPIKHYLLSRYSWTYYELSLFNDSFFIFPLSIINIFIKRILKNLKKYSTFTSNDNERIRLLINIAILYIKKKRPQKAYDLEKQIKEIKIQDNMIIEKLSSMYLNGLLKIINNNNTGFNLIKDSIICFKITNPTSYYIAIKNNYKEILKLYNIKDRIQ